MDTISAVIISPDYVYCELGELVTGKKIGRTRDNEITVFKSAGLAIEDAATAARVYTLARDRGIGKIVEV